MNVTIIGAGNVARGIGSRLVASGNHVRMPRPWMNAIKFVG
jgi:predicted dinucleotide-binding enzyme